METDPGESAAQSDELHCTALRPPHVLVAAQLVARWVVECLFLFHAADKWSYVHMYVRLSRSFLAAPKSWPLGGAPSLSRPRH